MRVGSYLLSVTPVGVRNGKCSDVQKRCCRMNYINDKSYLNRNKVNQKQSRSRKISVMRMIGVLLCTTNVEI